MITVKMPAKKPLWPLLLCQLLMIANLLLGLMLIIGVPIVFAEEPNRAPSSYIDFWVWEAACFMSAFSYWLVLRGYDVGRWVKLMANALLTFLFLYWAESGNNLKAFTVVLALFPLVWPVFLLLVFKREPELKVL
ncbi:MAG: hypothetical protein KGL40_12615 [Rhodocyclaceae bacterium]|nr:hypothetical protein [Rhodocyclaceae bacterium]